MADTTHDRWTHQHDFVPDAAEAERGTRWVMLLTAVTMVVEIIAGTMSGSMALLADGWHMATHVAAFAIAIFAYRYARTRAADSRFAFGTGKVTVLGGFASAVALAVVALMMAIESVTRLLAPVNIRFDDAIWVACIGLAVNLLSGVILHRAGQRDAGAGQGHQHAQGHDHAHAHSHQDHNLRAAYLHVVTDALTSVLAIVALFAGKFLGLGWLDATMGLVGAALITRWAWGLARDSSQILLDRTDDAGIAQAIRSAVSAVDAEDEIADLHLWQVAPRTLAAAVSIVSHSTRTSDDYRRKLASLDGLAHLTIEVNQCRDTHGSGPV